MKILSILTAVPFASLISLTSLRADTTTGNVLINPGAEEGLAGWTVGGNSGPHTDAGTFNPKVVPRTGVLDFVGGRGSFGSLTQRILVGGQSGISVADVDSGLLRATIGFWAQGHDQGTPSDSPRIRLSFYDGSLALISSSTTDEVDSHAVVWRFLSYTLLLPVGTRYVDYSMEFIRHQGTDNDAYVDDNSLTFSGGEVVPTLSCRSVGGDIELTWTPNAVWGLHTSATLLQGSWAPVTSPPASVDGLNLLRLPITSNRAFYRLQRIP